MLRFIANIWMTGLAFGMIFPGVILTFGSFFFEGPVSRVWVTNLTMFIFGTALTTAGLCFGKWLIERD